MEAYKRSQRVASRMREELTLLLRDMNDPRLVAPVITRVDLTDDLSFARIFVRQEASKRLLVGQQGLGGIAGQHFAGRAEVGEAAGGIQRKNQIARGFNEHAVTILCFGQIALNAPHAQRGLHARQNFALRKRLGDVVVRADIQPAHDLLRVA